jgi:hypothetical protein
MFSVTGKAAVQEKLVLKLLLLFTKLMNQVLLDPEWTAPEYELILSVSTNFFLSLHQ